MEKVKVILFDLDNTLFPFFNVEENIKITRLTIQKIKKLGYRLGIVSNCKSYQVWKKIDTLGIKNYIDVIVTPENSHSKKPMRKIFLKAIKELNVKPSQILFIGDHLIHDVWGARFCGMKTMLVKEKLKTYHRLIFIFRSFLGPDFLVNELEEVLDVLKTFH